MLGPLIIRAPQSPNLLRVQGPPWEKVSGSRRQLDRETGADRPPALSFDPTAEGFDDAPSKGKAEARAGARARGVGPEEWLEHPLEILGRQPFARVLHGDLQPVRRTGRMDSDGAVGRRVAHRIHEQVLEDPAHPG